MSTPNAITSSGTMTTPPPRPVSAPTNPAMNEATVRTAVKTRTVIRQRTGMRTCANADAGTQRAFRPARPALKGALHVRQWRRLVYKTAGAGAWHRQRHDDGGEFVGID